MSKPYSVEAAIASCRTTAFSMMCAIMSEPARREIPDSYLAVIERDGEKIEVELVTEWKQSASGDWYEDETVTVVETGAPIILTGREHDDVVRQIKGR